MGRLILTLMLLLALSSCVERQPVPRREYRYTIVDKKESVESHYNFLTKKQVVGTEYYIIAKDHYGNVVTHRCSLKEYYQYDVGKTYRVSNKWY